MSFPPSLAWMYSGMSSRFQKIFKYLNWKILQEKGWVEDGYAQRTGFNELAKSNDIVVMYPQVIDQIITSDSLKNKSISDQTQPFLQSKWMLEFYGIPE